MGNKGLLGLGSVLCSLEGRDWGQGLWTPGLLKNLGYLVLPLKKETETVWLFEITRKRPFSIIFPFQSACVVSCVDTAHGDYQ